ncbi:hypothetical protein T492DRAFT_947379, partial [Pavlovales sp. CCMP2436]
YNFEPRKITVVERSKGACARGSPEWACCSRRPRDLHLIRHHAHPPAEHLGYLQAVQLRACRARTQRRDAARRTTKNRARSSRRRYTPSARLRGRGTWLWYPWTSTPTCELALPRGPALALAGAPPRALGADLQGDGDGAAGRAPPLAAGSEGPVHLALGREGRAHLSAAAGRSGRALPASKLAYLLIAGGGRWLKKSNILGKQSDIDKFMHSRLVSHSKATERDILESSPDCCTKIRVEAEPVLCVDDAAKREVFGLQGGIGGVHAHTGFEEPKSEVAGLAKPTFREGKRSCALPTCQTPTYTAEGSVSRPAPGCSFYALDHATAWRLRAKLTTRLESDPAARSAHAAQHFGQLWPLKLCLPSRACIAPLLHLMENAFQYMHDKLVLARIELYVNSLTGLSKADKARLIAKIKGEAAHMLAACGVENAMSKGADGTLDKPRFQGGEVKALLCSRAFYNYVAYVVQQTSPTQPPPAPPPQLTAARASTPPSRPQMVAGSYVASHYANLANEPDSEEEDGLSPESFAKAAARWELDIAAVTGTTQQILLVLRAFDLLSQYFEHITSTDYNDALAEARKAHADVAEELARDFLAARSRRAARARLPRGAPARRARECANVLKLRRHRRAHRLEEHPRPRASAGLRARGRHGEEEPGSQENLQARGLPHPPLQLLRVEFNRTSALQLAEALAVREVSVFRAAAYVAHYAQSYQGQQLAQLLAAGAPVKRERVCFETVYEAEVE